MEMLNSFSSFFIKVRKTFFLDINEKLYVNSFNNKIEKNKIPKKNILYSATESYYPLCFSHLLSKEKKYKESKFIFYLPELAFYNLDPKKNLLIFIFKFYYKNLILVLRNKKWKRLYKTQSANFVSLNNFNIFKEIKNLKKASIIRRKIKNVKDLIKFSYKDINVGNLIYDTYLRFNNSATLKFNDFLIIEIIAKVINSYEKLKILKKKNKISEYYSNQLSYIQHGFIAKFFLKEKLPVNFTGAKGAYITKYKKQNYIHAFDFRKFRSHFKKLKNKRDKLLQAKKLLKVKFSGKIIPQENWMLFSAYNHSNLDFKLKKFKVIIFLHCFVDSPTARGKFLFSDFAEWINKTLEYFRDKNLSEYVAIKPHPHGKSASKIYVEELKRKYSDFQWINERVPNNFIFSKRPIIGLSVLGTVLPELAFHNIIPIACGTHYSMSYDFVFTPKTIKNYFKLIELGLRKKLKLPRNYKSQIYEYYYCDFIYDHPNNANLFAKKILLKNWNLSNNEYNNGTELKKYILKMQSFF
jgi:hypothetical protein